MPLRSVFASFLGLSPNDQDGPRAIYVPALMKADPVAGASFEFDLSQDALQQKVRFVQNVFIDVDTLAANQKATFRVLNTGYAFRVRGNTQGWYPLVATDDMKFRIEAPAAMIGQTIPLWLSNVPGLMTSWNTA